MAAPALMDNDINLDTAECLAAEHRAAVAQYEEARAAADVRAAEYEVVCAKLEAVVDTYNDLTSRATAACEHQDYTDEEEEEEKNTAKQLEKAEQENADLRRRLDRLELVRQGDDEAFAHLAKRVGCTASAVELYKRTHQEGTKTSEDESESKSESESEYYESESESGSGAEDKKIIFKAAEATTTGADTFCTWSVEQRREAMREAIGRVDFRLLQAERTVENQCPMCNQQHTTKEKRARCEERVNVDAMAKTLLEDEEWAVEMVNALCDNSAEQSTVQRSVLEREVRAACKSYDRVDQDHMALLRRQLKRCVGCRRIFGLGDTTQFHSRYGRCSVRHMILCLWRSFMCRSFPGFSQPHIKKMTDSLERALKKRFHEMGGNMNDVVMTTKVAAPKRKASAAAAAAAAEPKSSSSSSSEDESDSDDSDDDEEENAPMIENGRRSSRLNQSETVRALIKDCRETMQMFNADVRSLASKNRRAYMRNSMPKLSFGDNSFVGEISFRMSPAGDQIIIDGAPILIDAALGHIFKQATQCAPGPKDIDTLAQQARVMYLTLDDVSEESSSSLSSGGENDDDDDDDEVVVAVGQVQVEAPVAEILVAASALEIDDGFGGGGNGMDAHLPLPRSTEVLFVPSSMDDIQQRSKSAPPPKKRQRRSMTTKVVSKKKHSMSFKFPMGEDQQQQHVFTPPHLDVADFDARMNEQEMVSRERFERLESMLNRCVGAIETLTNEVGELRANVAMATRHDEREHATDETTALTSAKAVVKEFGSILADVTYLPPSVNSSPKTTVSPKVIGGSHIDVMAAKGCNLFGNLQQSSGYAWEPYVRQ